MSAVESPIAKKSPSVLRWFGLVLLAFLSAGAVLAAVNWQNSPRLVLLSGLVQIDGVPVKSGVLNFRAADPNRGGYAMGLIGHDGRYSAETPLVGPGIAPGKYLIGVLIQADPAQYTPEEYHALVGIGKPGIPSLVPKELADPATSQLTVTVTRSGPQTFDLNLPAAAEESGR